MDTLRLLGNRLRGRPTILKVDLLGVPLVLSVRARREIRRAREISAEAALVLRMLDFLAPGDVIYDVGANIGIIGLLLACHPKGRASRVHCFEPEPQNFEQLSRNIAANALGDRVTAHRIALGEREGDVTLFVRGGPGEGRHSVATEQKSKSSIRVPLRTLSAFADDVGESPDLVKIDVEGAEGRVLSGMDEMLRTHGPREIFLELHDKGDEDRMPDGTLIDTWLSEHGFAPVWEFARGRTRHLHYR